MSLSDPRISIVVPLYNKAKYIGRCLASIQAQTFEDFEVIVVDDGSTDGSGETVALIDPRIIVVRQENRGSSAARNRGIALARAPLIAFLDADDAWEPAFLEAIAGLAKTYPAAGVLATGHRRRLQSGVDKLLTLRDNGQQTRLIGDYFRVARQADLLTSSSIAVRRSLLGTVGGFQEGKFLGEDQDLWFRLCVFSPVAFDKRILATYHSESTGRTCNVLAPLSDTHPAIESLRRMLDNGCVPANRQRETEFHADWLLFHQTLTMLWDCSREQIQTLLRREQFRRVRFKAGSALLRMAMTFVSPRVLAAVRLKPASWLGAARRWAAVEVVVRALEAAFGNVVSVQFERRSEAVGQRTGGV